MFEVIVKNDKGEVEKSFKTGDDFTIIFSHPEDTKGRAYCTQLHGNAESAIMMLASLVKAIAVNMGYPLPALLDLLGKVGDMHSSEIKPDDMKKPLSEILENITKPVTKTKVQVLGLGKMDTEEKELAESITEFVEQALESGMSMEDISKILEGAPRDKGGLN